MFRPAFFCVMRVRRWKENATLKQTPSAAACAISAFLERDRFDEAPGYSPR